MTPAALGERTPVVVRMLTDWHVGAGHGEPGGADAVVVRDRDGLPYLPGTTLTGVLRDAARTVARALDDGADGGVWQQWAQVAFGDAGSDGPPLHGDRLAPAAVAFGPARLPAHVRAALRDRPDLRTATTTLRPGVRIDETTGRAADDMLRFVELARGGVSLLGSMEIDPRLTDEARTAVTALLVLAASWCDRVGGDRRRGPGEVAIEIGTERAVDWASWLEASGWMPPTPTPRTLPSPTAPAEPFTPTGRWTELNLVITTVDPVRAQARTSGNVVGGHDHLPGGLLLPWLSDRWGTGLVSAAVAADALVVRHAYPEVGDDRGLPVPFTVFRAKSGDDEAGIGSGPDGARPVRDRWTVAAPVAGKLVLQRPDTRFSAHNHVDRAEQRPTGATGIYQVEVIPAGTRLRGRLLLDDGLVAALTAAHGPGWAMLLAGSARFGARRRGEFGGCVVEVGQPAPVAVPAPPAAGALRLWAGSDLLVRGPGLRLSGDPSDVATALSGLLGTRVRLDQAAARTGRRDGWQARWQRPRESLVGLAAGSVLELTVDGRVDPAGWARLVVCGLGERGAEGFGEVLANPELLAPATLPVVDQPATAYAEPPPTGELDAADRATLDVLDRVARRERILAAVTAARTADVHRELRAVLAELSSSQRGTWRAVTVDAAVAGLPGRVLDHAGGWSANGNPQRADQRAVAERVTALLSGDRRIEDQLGVAPATDAERALALAALVADVVDALAREDV